MQNSIRSLFIVTSALNTKFGVFSNAERLDQTLETIKSIRKFSSNTDVMLVEMGGIPPTEEQISTIKSNVNFFLDYSKDPEVQNLFHNSSNWDIVKNLTEVLCFGSALELIKEHELFKNYKRIFKISGRYFLNEFFNKELHDSAFDKFVFLTPKRSQFKSGLTGGINNQYMTRLYSFSSKKIDNLIWVYQNGLKEMLEAIKNCGYIDIEHMMYKNIDPDDVINLSKVGVSGCLGPNGNSVSE